MKDSTNKKIQDNETSLKRTKASKYLLNSIINNPQVIVITTEECVKEYTSWWRKFNDYHFDFPMFVSIDADLTDLNKEFRPIIFDTHLILHE